jgi:hypothetical protein
VATTLDRQCEIDGWLLWDFAHTRGIKNLPMTQTTAFLFSLETKQNDIAFDYVN